jgi:hypothetical protein
MEEPTTDVESKRPPDTLPPDTPLPVRLDVIRARLLADLKEIEQEGSDAFTDIGGLYALVFALDTLDGWPDPGVRTDVEARIEFLIAEVSHEIHNLCRDAGC